MENDGNGTTARLVGEFSTLIDDAQQMLARASSESGDRARELRSEVEANLLRAKLRLQEMQGDAVEGARRTALATDDWVHDNPWRSMGMAAGIGFLLGLLVARR